MNFGILEKISITISFIGMMILFIGMILLQFYNMITIITIGFIILIIGLLMLWGTFLYTDIWELSK